MKIDSILYRRGGPWRLKTPGAGARDVCTVSEAARALGRSRRHVYRLIADGTVTGLGKAFGELLLDRASVARAEGMPRSPQRLPERLKPLFPEYSLRRLRVGRDRTLIVSRVLDRGTVQDVRWLWSRIPAPDIGRVVESDGARLLSPRSLRLWSLALGVKPKAPPAWRRDNPWLAARG